ncbi:mediator of RNA polymerase II transcription subunit 12 isoform X2 [Patella vulgata]|uniref:mediator of RNA polymerase II transcription subunit 12 isoform X2 n=1 Tax=Patella vulgata TaxID=6465 RepID=UPI0024A87E35|nr:mediator of RNA polymerase II transcription subunit 12 isoform X2 [Patella vulgata]
MTRRRFLCLIVCVSFVSVAGQTSQSTPSVDNSTSLFQTTDTLSNNPSNVAPSAPTVNSSTSTPGNSSILATSDAQSQNIPSTTTLSTLLSTGILTTQTDVTARRAMLTTTTTSLLTAPVNDQSQPQSNAQQPKAQSNNTPNTAGPQHFHNISSTIPTQPDLQSQAQSQTAPVGSLGEFGMTMTCPTPVDIPGASYRIFGAFAVYQCRPGYLTARYVSMCLPDSTWLPPNITCKPKDCGNKIPVVDGATSTYDKTIFGSSVMYRCKETDGYHYESGTTTVTCGADGLWSDINLKCALNTYRPMTQNSQQIPQTSIMPKTENSLMRNLGLFVATAESALSSNNKMSAFELLSAFKTLLSGQSDMETLNSSLFSGISVPVAPTPIPTSFPSLDQQLPGSFPGIPQQFPQQSRFFTNAPSQFFPQQPQFPQSNYQNYLQQQQPPQQQNQQQQPFRNPFQQPSNQFPYNPFPYNPNNYQQYPSQQFQQFQQQQYNPRPMNPYPQQPGMNMFTQQQPTGNTFQQQPTQQPARNALLPSDTKSQTNEQQPDSQQQNNLVPVQAQQQPVQAQQQSVQAPRQPVQTPQQPVQTPKQPVQNPQVTQPLLNNVPQQLQPANNMLVQQQTFANTSPQVPNQSQLQSSSAQNQSPQQQPAHTIIQQPNQLSQQTPQQSNTALPQQTRQQPQSTNNVFSQNLPQSNRFLPNDPRPQNQPTQQTIQNTMPQQPTQPQTNVFSSQNQPTQQQTNVFSQNLPNQQPIRNTMSQQNPQHQQQSLHNTQQQLQQNPQQQQQPQQNPQQKQQPQQPTPPFRQQQPQQQTMGQFPQNPNTNTKPQANQPGNSPTQVSRAEMENALRGILGPGGYNSMSPQLKRVLLGPMPVTNTAPTNQQVKTPTQTQPPVTDPYMAMLASAQSLNNNMNMNNMFGFGGQPPNNMSDPFAAMGMGTGMGLGGASGMMNNLMMDPEMVAEMNEQRMAGGAGLNGGMGALNGVLGGAGNKPGTNPLAAMFGPSLPGFGVMDPQGTMQGGGTGNPFDAMMTGGHPAAGSMKPGQPGAQDAALMALLNGMAPGQGQNLAGGTALDTNPGVNPAATGTSATNGLNAETMQMMRSLGLVKK